MDLTWLLSLPSFLLSWWGLWVEDWPKEWKTHEVKKPDSEEVKAKEMGTYTI